MQSGKGMSQAGPGRGRRTTAAALKQQILAVLAESLPRGWISQPLSPARAQRAESATQAGTSTEPSADILVISPRGRCHFLFVRAPADRWWDGEVRSVPAEKVGEAEATLARQLRAAGHKARAVWSERDLWRALRSWGCPLNPRRHGEQSARQGTAAAEARRRETGQAGRPILHLDFGRGRAHG